MGQHPEATITITGCDVLRSGTGSNGKDWTLYNVTANNPEGQPIAAKLRCFKNLPVGQTIEVEIEDRSTEQYGKEYTLHYKGASAPRQQQSGEAVSGDHDARIKTLETKVAALERRNQQDIPF